MGPALATREEMVTRLPLTATVPPALVRAGLVGLVVEVRPNRRAARQELAVPAGHRLLVRRSCCRRRPFPAGGLYHRPALAWLEIRSRDLASVATLVVW